MRRSRLILALVAGGLTASACASSPEPTAPASSPLVALTPRAYNNTVRDLLGLPARGEDWPAAPEVPGLGSSAQSKQPFAGDVVALPAWPWAFPPEPGVDGFGGMAAGQVASLYAIEGLQRAAVHFALYALVSPTFFTCEGWSSQPPAQQQSCGWASVLRFAQRAYRRPIEAGEQARLQAL